MSYGSIPYAWRPPLNIRARLKLSSWQIPTGGPLAHLWIPLRFREAAQYLVLTSDLLTVGGVVVGGGVHAPLCPINQKGTAKIRTPQKTKSISIWCCNNTMVYLPRQRAGNCYQLPVRGLQSVKYSWWMKLLFVCQIPQQDLKIFNDSINIYIKRWGVGKEWVPHAATDMFVCLKFVKIQTWHTVI